MKLETHPFTLRQLQYAVAVADALSFHKAAALCHVSQPSLSAQLAQLEDALGTRLFERDRRRVLVTGAGQPILERARALLTAADDLVAAARLLTDPLAGTLRLGVIPTISPYLLPAATPELRRRFPRLEVVWVEDKTATLARALDDGALDAALLALEAELGDVAHEVIAKDPFVLVAPPGGKADPRPARAADLRGQGVLLLDDGHCFRDQALAVCADANAHELAYRATSLTTLTQMVAAGAGVTLLPELALPTESRRTHLRIRRFARPAPFRTIALVWRRRSPLGPALAQLAAALRDVYPREGPR